MADGGWWLVFFPDLFVSAKREKLRVDLQNVEYRSNFA